MSLHYDRGYNQAVRYGEHERYVQDYNCPALAKAVHESWLLFVEQFPQHHQEIMTGFYLRAYNGERRYVEDKRKPRRTWFASVHRDSQTGELVFQRT